MADKPTPAKVPDDLLQFLKVNATLQGGKTNDDGTPAAPGKYQIVMRPGRMFAGIAGRMTKRFADAFPGCEFTFTP